MKNFSCRLISALLLTFVHIYSQNVLPPRYSFMQANYINTVFINNGIYNYDWWTFTTKDAGFIWPVTSSQRMTADYTTGIYILAKVNGQLRAAGSYYSSHFTGGFIPVPGEVPPVTVCMDSAFKVYLVSVTDQSLVNGGTRTVTAGGRQYTLNFTSWAGWPVNQGAPYYEVNNIPGYQPGWNSDRPNIGNGSSAKPDQLLFTVYMDYTNCTNNLHQAEIGLPGGTLPTGAEIQQIAFAFSCYPLQNMYFIKYRIINKSSMNWDSTYIGLINDADIGAGSCGAVDDAGGCDSVRNMSFVYNADNSDCNYGVNPPALGSRMLQSPIRFTGNPLDTAKLPYGIYIGYKLIGMTSSFTFKCGYPCLCEPNDAEEAYYVMRGLNTCGNPYINPVTGLPTKFVYSGNSCSRTGWIDSVPGDRKYLMNSGPFSMAALDTQIVVFSLMISRDGSDNFDNVCKLQTISDSALKYYYNDFQTCIPIGIQPISTEVPDRFMLYQNNPNPFNPVTTIRFAVPSVGQRHAFDVQLVIYDVLGREIAALVNEELNPGTYEVEWLAESYPSGVYFYTISSGNYYDSKKMLLIK